MRRKQWQPLGLAALVRAPTHKVGAIRAPVFSVVGPLRKAAILKWGLGLLKQGVGGGSGMGNLEGGSSGEASTVCVLGRLGVGG